MSILFFLFSLLFANCQSEKELSEPVLELSQDTLVCLQTATNATVQVKTNAEWTATVPSNAAGWCTITPSGTTLSIKLMENPDDGIRETDATLVAGPLQKKLRIRQLGQAPDILISTTRINLNYRDTVIDINVVSNVAYDILIPDTIDWIKPVPQGRAVMQTFSHSFRIPENKGDELRFTNISFKAKQQDIKRDIMIRQDKRDKTYKPGTPDGLGDVLIAISRAEADQQQPGEGIELSFDGDPSTWYHSPWSGTRLPVTLDYYFETPQEIDYFVYTPRSSGDNGNFGQFDLFATTDAQANQKIGTYDFKQSSVATRIAFDTPLKNVKSMRFVVKSGTGGFASCGEMGFYRKGAAAVGLEEIFADKIYSELKPGVTQKQVDGIENTFFRSIAQSLFDGTYDTTYRVQEYEPYRPLNDLAAEMKTSGYNPFENPTGIHFQPKEEVVIIVGDTHGEPVALNVYDFDRTRRLQQSNAANIIVPLYEGINKIKLADGGLGYINYFTMNWKEASRIKIHIPSGKVNGYFDKKRDAAADWMKILNQTTYGCIDIKGDHVNLCYGVSSLKTYCKDLPKLIDNYDAITLLEHDLMGLIKYNRQPKNHMFARVTNGGLFADGWGAGFYEGCMDELADINKCMKQGVWAIAHELGHVNQIRPGLKWVSTTEVTNNVYSVYVRYKNYRENMPLEHERVNDGDNNNVLGGRFNSYLNYGIVKGEQWLCQRGQDKMDGYQNGGDHFVKLCPIWQLMLYYREIAGKRDWYGDVAEIVRRTDESNLSNGELQLNFMRNTCDVVKEDLTDFFIKAGMLKPIDKDMDDYARGQLTITQQQCDDLVRYASRYPKPATPVLYYLTANSEQAYKQKLPVTGTYNEGVKVRSDERIVVDHKVWKNAAVFETYKGNELTFVAMVGTDSPDQSTTLVRYPAGSTRIEAVSWDGKRTLVYGTK